MDLLSNLHLGFQAALSLANLLYALAGVTIGTFIGVLPGIGPMATIAILLPLTFGLDPLAALIMLSGIYYGSMYGSAITSILLNTPGHAASAVVCVDGYPLAKKGKGGVALVLSALSSFAGGSLAIILVAAFAPMISQFALRFSSPEYFSIMLLGLTAAAGISQGSLLRGLAMVVFGLIVGTVGTDTTSGAQRFTFGSWDLADGISFVILAMGFFAITEMILNLESPKKIRLISTSFSFSDIRESCRLFVGYWASVLRGFAIGAFFGALPGSGPTVSTFIAYSAELSAAKGKEKENFGKGAYQGVIGPEAANNSASIAGFVPTLTLGIPGDAVMAMMLGALLVFGITPGPAVIANNPTLFWGLIASLWIGNVFLLVLNIPLISVWVKTIQIPYSYLYPAIVVFICIGVISVNNKPFDVALVAAFGAIGYLLAKLDMPMAPALLGAILGPMIEDHFRRSLLMGRGDFAIFVSRPISAFFIITTALIILWILYSNISRPRAPERLQE